MSQLLLASNTALVADKEKLQNFITEFGKVCEKEKLKANVAENKMRCKNDGGLGGAEIVLNGDNCDRWQSFAVWV